jgi:hypothetical protein
MAEMRTLGTKPYGRPGFHAPELPLLIARRLDNLSPADRRQRETYVPLIATTVSASAIRFMAQAGLPSLSAAPVYDNLDRLVIGELLLKALIQPQILAPHDEKTHPAPHVCHSRMTSLPTGGPDG